MSYDDVLDEMELLDCAIYITQECVKNAILQGLLVIGG